MRTIAGEYAELMAFVSDRIKEAEENQSDKTKPLSPNIVWGVVADWVFINSQ